jgi:hypothetical protein
LKQKGTGKSAHDLANDATLSKATVAADLPDNNADVSLIHPDDAKEMEKSDADLDREQLDRIRQRFNAQKASMQNKKKAKLDMDDDEEDNDDVASTKNNG